MYVFNEKTLIHSENAKIIDIIKTLDFRSVVVEFQ